MIAPKRAKSAIEKEPVPRTATAFTFLEAMTAPIPVWQEAVLASVDGAAAERVRPILQTKSGEQARALFEEWMGRYEKAELARDPRSIVDKHECCIRSVRRLPLLRVGQS